MSSLTEESTSRFATINGAKVHYNEAGSGPAVVMLHGGGPGATGWSNFVRNIDHLARNHRVLLVDQPGFGQTDYLGNAEPISQLSARVVRDLLDHLGIDKCTPVGNSMGASSSVNFAVDYPERTEKLVLMGGASVGGQSSFVPQPTEGIKVLSSVAQNPTLEGMRRMISYLVYDDSFVTEDLLKQRLEAALKTTRHEGRAPQRRLDRELEKVKAKTLVIWGANDMMAPLDFALRFLWNIQDAQLHIFSKCGHWAQFEHAEDFNHLVSDFLDRQ